MKQSIVLRRAPTHRQAREILVRLRSELETRGAVVELTAFDALRFRMPRPWRAPRPGWLLAVTSGSAEISAAGGGPWRVRYALSFAMLRVVVLALSVVLAYIGRDWPRLSLLNGLVILWLSCYLLLSLAAAARFSRLLRAAARDMIERRRRPRPDSEDRARARRSGSRPADAPTDDAASGTTDTPRDETPDPRTPRADAARADAPRTETPRPDLSA